MDSNHKERKARLSKMRERTKALLQNHDWERFLPFESSLKPFSSDDDPKTTTTTAGSVTTSANNNLDCSLSAINHLDFDSLLNDNTNLPTNTNNMKTPAASLKNNIKFQQSMFLTIIISIVRISDL